MDIALLNFFNHTLANPWLDLLMIGLTTVGFALLPALGISLSLIATQRKTGITILASLLAGLLLTLLFQYLAFRTRPEAVRLILQTPQFPSFPSGHAVAAFGVATVVGLTYRQLHWRILALVGAILIAASRVYLGHHYPADILAGSVLGAAVGAACYGLIGLPRPVWKWLLWPQIAIVIVITQMAYLNVLPSYLLQLPFTDKLLHFLLFGAVAFWLNIWLNGQNLQLGRWPLPVAVLLPLTVAMIEEGSQAFSPYRTADFGDLISDTLGMAFFWWVSTRFVAEQAQPTSNGEVWEASQSS